MYNTLITTLLFISATFLQGCDTEQFPVYNVHPELAPYYKHYQNLYNHYPLYDAYMVESLPDKSMLGFARIYNNGLCTIHISKEHWVTLNELQREWLMLHEISHCRGLYKHDDAVFSDGCPITIMNRYNKGASDCYKNNRSYYIKELGERYGSYSR